jgi:Flavin containing amine oxidoreductase.
LHCEIDYCFRFQIIDNSCTSLYNLSAKAWGQYEFCGGDDYINLTQGFSSVIDTMEKQIPSHLIRYQCPVEQILWRDSNDQVNDLCNGDTIDGNSIEKDTFTNGIGEEVEEIIVKCEDGTIYRTKHVVVTASLGYLKENQNRLFVPRLPQHWSQVMLFVWEVLCLFSP